LVLRSDFELESGLVRSCPAEVLLEPDQQLLVLELEPVAVSETLYQQARTAC
jgi:hypothetical protein